MRTLAAALLAAAAFVLNPAGCTGPTFQFTAHDVAKAVAGTWTYTKGTTHLTFRLEPFDVERHSARASLLATAHACGNRTLSLVREAGACTDTSTMRFDVLVADARDVQGTAQVVVAGTHFNQGHLQVRFNAGDSFEVSIESSGEIVATSHDDSSHVTHTR